jgi:predicted RNA-binding Zn ribbon-like protein
MSRAETNHDSDWRDGFLFLGNQLALDFLNTCPVLNGEATELLPDFSALVRWFQAADLLSSREAAKLEQDWGRSARAQRALEALRELRERLRKQVIAWEDDGTVHSSTIEELNQLMQKHPMRSRLKRRGNESTMEQYFEAQQPEDLFAPLAHGAAALFANVDRSRVRKCDNCVLHFQDTCKKGTRRWCSMRFCGNRLKVAAYAARHARRGK